MSNLPYFSGHGTVLNFNPTSGESIADMSTFYPLSIHGISPAVVGNKGFLFIQVGYQDFVSTNSCNPSSLPTLEAEFQNLWVLAHADGWQIVEVTNPANSHAVDGGACSDNSFTNIFQQFNLWLKAQSSSYAQVTGSKEYWDYIVDAAALLNNGELKSNDPYWTQTGNPPHFTDQANENIANLANATLIQGATLQLRSGCANGDGCFNLNQSNWLEPYPDPSNIAGGGMTQQIQVPSADTNAAWEAFIVGKPCVGFGYTNAFSSGFNDPEIYVSSSSICGGGNNFPYLNFHSTGQGFVYSPGNIAWGFAPPSQQGATDVSISRDRPGVFDFGSGGSAGSDKSGAANMAWIALGGASHTSGNSFDCSGTGCPVSPPSPISQTVSGVTEIDFTTCITSAARDYDVRIDNLQITGSGVQVGIQFSTNGGSTYDTASNYNESRSWSQMLGGGGNGFSNPGAGSYLDVSGNPDTYSTGEFANITYRLYYPLNTTNYKQIKWSGTTGNGTSNAWSSDAAGTYVSTSAVNAFRIYAGGTATLAGSVTCQPLAQ